CFTTNYLVHLQLDIKMLSTNQPIRSTVPIAGFNVRQTVDQLNLIGLTIAQDGTLTYANPYMYRVTAWAPEEIIGQNFFDQLIPKSDQVVVRHDLEEAMARGGFMEHKEIELLARSGALRNVQLNSLILDQTSDGSASFTLIGEDVTNKKRVASALSFSNAQLQDLVDNTSDLIQML